MKMRSNGMPDWVKRQSRALAELDPRTRQKLNDAKGRLHWLIEFCQRDDLASLKNKEMDRLDAEMITFVLRAWQPGAVSRDKPDATRLIETATKVRDGLRALMGEVSGGWRLPFSELNGMTSFLTRYRPSEGGPSEPLVSTSGELYQRFLYLAFDLVKQRASWVGRCDGPDCGRLFVITKRQAYCNSLCSQRARNRRYQDSHSREELSEARHRAYLRKVETEKGPSYKRRVRRNRPRAAATAAD
jgi:hypothetical protein